MKINNKRGSIILEVAIGTAMLTVLAIAVAITGTAVLKALAETRRDAERSARAEAAVGVASSWVAASGTPTIHAAVGDPAEALSGSALRAIINGTDETWFSVDSSGMVVLCGDGSRVVLAAAARPTPGQPVFSRSVVTSPWEDAASIGTVVYADPFSGSGLVVMDLTIPTQNLRIRRGLSTLGL